MSKIYKVYRDYDSNIKLAAVEVVSETPGKILLGDRHLSFNHRKQILKAETTVCRTPDEAVDQFLDESRARIDDLYSQVERIKREMGDAQDLRPGRSP